MSIRFYIDEKKYRIKPTERYIRVNGWAFDTEGRNLQYKAVLNGKAVDNIRVKTIKRPDVEKKYGKYPVGKTSGFHIKCFIDAEEPGTFELYVSNGAEKKCIIKLNEKQIVRLRDDSTISYNIDLIYVREAKAEITGWVSSVKGADAVRLDLRDTEGNAVEFKEKRSRRADLVETGLIDETDIQCGFKIDFFYEEQESFCLSISDGIKVKHISFDLKDIRRKQSLREKVGFVRAARKYVTPEYAKKTVKYIKKNGFSHLREHIFSRVMHAGKSYGDWFEENKPTEEELKTQKNTIFERNPLISIIVPTYKTPIPYLREMMDSVLAQTYPNWELCIADGSEGDQEVEAELEKYSQSDKRIKYRILEKNLGISGNTNGALELAEGEYIGLFDHDDILAPNALFEIVKALQEKDYDILYTDEDKVDGDGKEHLDPNFKPDFSIDLFRSHNYITHFFVVKKKIVDEIGGFRPEFDGSQDYDLMFRCIEKADSIKHIPMILYHWRVHMNSVAGDPSSKMYAYEAGKRAIEEHLKRMGIDATVEHVGLWGMYHVKYAVHGDPLVSIIIPNKDHVSDLKKCIDSLYTVNRYKNFEIIIVENNSEEKETFAYYKQLEEKHENIKVLTWEKEFNYSAINNFGVKSANGDYLLFLNNDTEVISPDAVEEMLGCCMREDVGAVGAKLLYEDDTVQHAGVVIGFGGYAGHVNTGIGRDDYGYMVRARISCNYSAVTAACMMTKKSLFNRVGGFDEQFVIACNDVDYCLKLRELDKWIVFNAFAEWHHYESKSRGYEDTKEKQKRFAGEVEKFQKKWKTILDEGDPFYNKNFPITQAPFTL